MVERQNLTEMLNGLNGRILLAVGVRDGFEAALLQQMYAHAEHSKKLPVNIGGVVAFGSGYQLSASLGLPDMEFITLPDVVDYTEKLRDGLNAAAKASHSESLPLIVDIDLGVGAHPYAIEERTVRKLYKMGADAVQIEDQDHGKSCGHMAGAYGTGKKVIPIEEMVDMRIAPCVAYSLEDGVNFNVVARVDSIKGDKPEDVKEAIERGKAYAKAGARMVFIESPQTDNQLKLIGQEFKGSGTVLVANMIEYGKTPYHTPLELQQMGFGVALYCIGTLLASHNITQQYMLRLLGGNSPLNDGKNLISPSSSFSTVSDMLGRSAVEKRNMGYLSGGVNADNRQVMEQREKENTKK